jgi:hypothetical protein
MEIISVGFYCLTSHYIRSITNDRSESYPFDWLFTSIDMVKHCIETKFAFFLDKKYYISNGLGMFHIYYQPFINNLMIHTHNEGFIPRGHLPRIFNHHNLTRPDVYESFKRRCERFLKTLENTTIKVKLIYSIKFYGEDENDFEDIKKFSEYMLVNYPNVKIYCFKFIDTTPNIPKDPRLVVDQSNLQIYNIYIYSKLKGPLDLSIEAEQSIKEILYKD